MSTGTSVLVIDDERGIREMLAYELSHEGFDVATADSGAAALGLLRSRRFDLAITDLKMPGMDGVETVEALRALDPDIEVIVATGHATVETAVACMKRGAYDYIEKPYDLDELQRLLGRALQKSHLEGVVALYEASRVLVGTLRLEDLNTQIVELTRNVLRADAMGLLTASSGDPAHEQPWTTEPSVPVDLLQELTKQAGPLGRAVRLPAAAEESGNVLAAAGFGSALVLPLVARGSKLGTLLILRGREAPTFSASELNRGLVFAGQVALSLHNARLYEELSERVGELVATRDRLVQSERARAAVRLAAGVAHEINNPLTYVQTNIEALRDYSTGLGALWLAAKEAAAYLRSSAEPEARALSVRLLKPHSSASSDDMDDCIADFAEIVDEVLDGVGRIADLIAGFRCIASPAERAVVQTVDLACTVADGIEALKRRADQHGLWLADGSPGVRIEGEGSAQADAEKLRCAITLVLSALFRRRDSDPQHPIEVRVCGGAQGAEIHLKDSHLRLSDEERRHLLDPEVLALPAAGNRLQLDLAMLHAYQLVVACEGGFEVMERDGATVVLLTLPPAGE